MTRVTIAAPDNRKTVMVADDTSIKDILDTNSVNFTRASIILDGMQLTPTQLRQTITELGATGDCTLAVCVKLDNASF